MPQLSNSISETTFINEFYKKHISQLLKTINQNSKKLTIDKEKAEKWINSQPDTKSFPNPRNAARNLIDNTVHVSLTEVKTHLEILVKKHYDAYVNDENNKNKDIYLYMGEGVGKSNFYITLLAYHIIRTNGSKRPTYFLKTLPGDFDQNTMLVFYFDDMTYSGGQIVHTIQDILKDKLINVVIEEAKKNHLDIKQIETKLKKSGTNLFNVLDKLAVKSGFATGWQGQTQYIDKLVKEKQDYVTYPVVYLLLGANDMAIKRINSLVLDINYHHYMISQKVNIHYAKEYDALEQKVTEKELFEIAYYFSYGQIPNVSILYDHKIADATSTFLLPLSTGAIVPDNFNLLNYYNLSKETCEKQAKKFQNNSYTRYRYFHLLSKFFSEIKQAHKTQPSQDIRKQIRFCPFLKHCTAIKKLTDHKNMKYVNYLMVMTQEINEYNEIPLPPEHASPTVLLHDSELIDVFYNVRGYEDTYTDEDGYPIELIEDFPNVFRIKGSIPQDITVSTRERILKFLYRFKNDRCHATFYKNKKTLRYKNSLSVDPLSASKTLSKTHSKTNKTRKSNNSKSNNSKSNNSKSNNSKSNNSKSNN